MSEAESRYRLTLKGDGFTLEREVSKVVAREIITMVLSGDDLPQMAPQAQATSTVMRHPHTQQQPHHFIPKKSLREYLNEVGARKNPQKILAIANYLNAVQGKTLFSIADIKPQFKLANEPLPANINRDIQIVSDYGWIAQDHEDRKMYFVTKTGLDALASRFE